MSRIEPGPWMIEAEKRDMALQMRAALLLAKIKIMHYELFHPTSEEIENLYEKVA